MYSKKFNVLMVVLGVLIAAIGIALPAMLALSAPSIGIIGGADGPTAVFITTPGWTHWIVPVVLLLVGLAGFLYFSKQHKRASEGEE